MENFDWTSFERKIVINTSVQAAYDAWASAATIESWFLSKAIFSDENELPRAMEESIQAGDRYAWSWYGYDVVETGSIKVANGIDRIQFTFAGECLVDLQFKEAGGSVIVILSQSNIPTDDQSKRNIRLGCDSGWSFFLVNLKSVLEGGLDLRNKDDQFKGLVNN